MEIRHTEPEMIPQIVEIYGKARRFMRRTGNMHQWSDSYPSADSLASDIAAAGSYVCIDGGRIVATFFFRVMDEPTYGVIAGGKWLNDNVYGVVHRVASDGSVKGVMHRILDYCFERVGDIRIDTHRDNKVMQQSLQRYGFSLCGTIFLADGAERLAYHKCNHQ